MHENRSWKEYTTLAKHYLAIGEEEIFLFRDQDAPWHLATAVESGGTWRLGVPVSLSFRGKDPASGLQFRWGFDVEQAGSNGNGSFALDMPRIRKTANLMPEAARKEFFRLLKEMSTAIRKKGDEYQAVANDQYGIAAQLETLES